MGGEGNINGGSGFRHDHRQVVEQALNAQHPLNTMIDEMLDQQNLTLAPETDEARRQRLKNARNKLGPFLAEQTILHVVEEQLQAALNAGIQDFVYDAKLHQISTLQTQIELFKNGSIALGSVSRVIRGAAKNG